MGLDSRSSLFLDPTIKYWLRSPLYSPIEKMLIILLFGHISQAKHCKVNTFAQSALYKQFHCEWAEAHDEWRVASGGGMGKRIQFAIGYHCHLPEISALMTRATTVAHYQVLILL